MLIRNFSAKDTYLTPSSNPLEARIGPRILHSVQATIFAKLQHKLINALAVLIQESRRQPIVAPSIEQPVSTFSSGPSLPWNNARWEPVRDRAVLNPLAAFTVDGRVADDGGIQERSVVGELFGCPLCARPGQICTPVDAADEHVVDTETGVVLLHGYGGIAAFIVADERPGESALCVLEARPLCGLDKRGGESISQWPAIGQGSSASRENVETNAVVGRDAAHAPVTCVATALGVQVRHAGEGRVWCDGQWEPLDLPWRSYGFGQAGSESKRLEPRSCCGAVEESVVQDAEAELA